MADSAKINYTGRMIVSLEATEVAAEEIKIIQHSMTAGIILFARNYKNPEQLKQLIAQIQYHAKLAGKDDVPIFVDQEGGYVQRFGRGFSTPLPAPEVIGTTYDIEKKVGLALAFEYGKRMAEPLMEVGVLCLGPVLDLDAGNKVISGLGRAFHQDPQSCAELAAAYIAGMNAAGMPAVAKHFPGHGRDIGDSHVASPEDNRELGVIEASDLIPFILNIDNIAAIMTAHITYLKVDPENTAGMSKIWLQDLLRDVYGFTGIVISDCLAMAGAGATDDLAKTIKAMEYGDIALLCNKTPAEFLTVLDALAGIKDTDKKEAAASAIEAALSAKYIMSAETNARFEAWVASSRATRQALGQQYAEQLVARAAGAAAATEQPLVTTATAPKSGVNADVLDDAVVAAPVSRQTAGAAVQPAAAVAKRAV